jgi:hypothetical protein
MVSTLARPASPNVVPTTAATPGDLVVRCAADLAIAYDQQVAAYWRGEVNGKRDGAWLEGCWQPTLIVPPGPPLAISVYGGGGRGIAWYDTDLAVIGCVRGCAGGYWIRRGAPLGGTG